MKIFSCSIALALGMLCATGGRASVSLRTTEMAFEPFAQCAHLVTSTQTDVEDLTSNVKNFTTAQNFAKSTAQAAEEGVDFEINMYQGSFTRTNESGTYASEWTSYVSNPALVLSTPKNDMCAASDGQHIYMYSGRANSALYTISVSAGYELKSYTLTFKNASPDTYNGERVTAGGVTYTATNYEQTVEVKNINAPAAQITLNGSNTGIEVVSLSVRVEASSTKTETQQNLFITDAYSAYPYRIPAIAKARNGHLVAVSDYRICGSDIGYGRVDIKGRISTDEGATWGPEFSIAEGTGRTGAVDCGFGDAAIVADAESDELLLISVCGNTVYGASSTTRNNPNRIARFYSYDNGQTWTPYEQITEQIYSLFDKSLLGPVQSCFFGSGRICQSRIVKVGTHYRLYAALCARPGGNRVVYSDDFGKTWSALGSIDISPVPQGDEPKCEELPDGTVVISSRMNGGRYFNFYTYSDVERAEGTWGRVASSTESNGGTSALGNATNGELLIVPAVRTSDNTEVYVALQSVPFGHDRNNVGIYYKELYTSSDMATPFDFAADWDGKHQASYTSSAYSTMVVQQNGHIAFLYEESTFGHAYTTVYKQYSLEEITDGAYTYSADVNRGVFVGRKFRDMLQTLDAKAGPAVGMLDENNLENLKAELIAVIEKFEQNPTAQALLLTDSELSRMINEAYLKIQPGMRYVLENKLHRGYYLSVADERLCAVQLAEGLEQSFDFVAADADLWNLHSEAVTSYVAPTGQWFGLVNFERDSADAGLFGIAPSADGWTELVCSNPVAPYYNVLCLSPSDNYGVIAGYSGDEAALWRIVPTGVAVNTDISVPVWNIQSLAPVYYSVDGRKFGAKPAQGVYITSDKRKHLAQ